MNIRVSNEELEEKILSKNATLSKNTKGRLIDEEKCHIRTDFARDRDRIVHSKAFRRLKHKAQVFISPNNDHYRTRLTHTLEVSQIAVTISKALRLNVDLAEAISLGHDLGHTPFGHAGEKTLNKLSSCGFKHNEQSLRVIDVLEKGGQGLNLTYEVRNGILNHTGSLIADTFEGKVLKYADRIAYLNHDIDDVIRAGILTEDDLPKDVSNVLGCGHSKRINTLITDVITSTSAKGEVCMSEPVYHAMMKLREFMFDNVYTLPFKEEAKIELVIGKLFEYYMKNLHELPFEFKGLLDKWGENKVVCDYIASMTDGFCLMKFDELFVPKRWAY